jgi:hypothetical protein
LRFFVLLLVLPDRPNGLREQARRFIWPRATFRAAPASGKASNPSITPSRTVNAIDGQAFPHPKALVVENPFRRISTEHDGVLFLMNATQQANNAHPAC